MRKFLVLLILLTFSTSSFAQEQIEPIETPVDGPNNVKSPSPDELVKIRKRVEFLLSGYEFFPKRADLDAVAPGEVITGVLQAIVEDEDARPSMRTRAVDALGYYDDDETQKFLIKKMSTEVVVKTKMARVYKSIRHHAMTSFAKSLREKSVPQITPFLKNDSLQVRLTAITALGKFGGKDGRAELIKAKPLETHNVAKSAFRKYVPDTKKKK